MLSFDTASAISAYRHAKAFRKRGAYIVGGGYHATAMPEEAAKYCDTVISGPAERAVPAFFRDYLAGSPKPFYRDTNLCAADYPVPQRKKIPMHGKENSFTVDIPGFSCIYLKYTKYHTKKG